jgi:hypothetical protein
MGDSSPNYHIGSGPSGKRRAEWLLSLKAIGLSAAPQARDTFFSSRMTSDGFLV